MPGIINWVRTGSWLAAMLVALAASSASIYFAHRYGTSVHSGTGAQFGGAILAVADVVKIGLPALMAALWARNCKPAAAISAVIFAFLIVMSLFATVSVTTIERAATDAEVTAAAKADHDLREELKAAEARIIELGSPLPLKAVEAQIDGFKSDARWRTTASCNPSQITAAGSRRFCEKMAFQQAALATATEADALRERMAQIRSQIGALTPESTRVASPELVAIASAIGWRPEAVGLGRAIFLAVTLELLGGFVPSFLWLVRPALPSTQPQTGMAPIEEPKVAEALPAREPVASPSAPKPPTAPRGKPKKRNRGRPARNQDAISFAEAYMVRHGKPPSIGHIEKMFRTYRAVPPRVFAANAWKVSEPVCRAPHNNDTAHSGFSSPLSGFNFRHLSITRFITPPMRGCF